MLLLLKYTLHRLEKATKQYNIMFSPAWLAYGHSFAVENEQDTAMAASIYHPASLV